MENRWFFTSCSSHNWPILWRSKQWAANFREDFAGSGASLVSLSGGSHTLVECYREYFGSGYTKNLADYPIFDVRLLKRCIQKTASVVFGTLGPFSMTDFIFTRLKGAKQRDWMQLRQFLRMAVETGDLFLPGLLVVVSNIIGVWPLIVSYIKETGQKDSGDSLVVWFFLWVSFSYNAHIYSCFLVQKKESDGYFHVDQLGRMKFRLFHHILEMC